MLKRSIDLIDPLDLTIKEKIVRNAKRVCIVFAVAAVALSTLDLMNIRSVANAAEFADGNRQRFADLPDLIRTGIQSITLASPAPSAVAMIPRGEIAMTVRPTLTAAVESRIVNDASSVAGLAVARAANDASPVAALAAADHMDAVEFAMNSRLSWKNSQSPFAAAPAPAPESAPEPIVLASADPAPLQLPPIAPTPVSLPMSNAVPFDMVAMPQPPRVTNDASPVAELAAARHLDAVEVAMESPLGARRSQRLRRRVGSGADNPRQRRSGSSAVAADRADAGVVTDVGPDPARHGADCRGPRPVRRRRRRPSCCILKESPTPKPSAASPTRSISRRAANR